MGRSVRFAGNPGDAEESRIERFAGQHALSRARAEEKSPG
jgi:hypothetical protein